MDTDTKKQMCATSIYDTVTNTSYVSPCQREKLANMEQCLVLVTDLA